MKFKAKLFAKPGPVWCNRANFLKQEVGPGPEVLCRSPMFNLGEI
jgi:hypothetical protein